MSGTITFPPNPTDGQLYTAGGVTWQWHANPGVWVNANTGTNFLALSGGTMTGPITLPGNAASALQAVPLQQVVPLAGGVTMTGALTLSGNAATALQATPLQQVNAVVAPAFNDVGRNLLHNAMFNIQQRGQGPFGNGVYTADRWASSVALDTNSFTVYALNDTDKAQIGDEAAVNGFQDVFTGNAAAGSITTVLQPIEWVWRLAGKTVTISFWARCTTGTLRIGLNILQYFGTGGSPSAAVRALATGNSVTINTTWARYSTTIALPSMAGKTLGSNGDSYTRPELWLSSGATFNAAAGNIGVQSGTVQLWGVQLEVGSVMTALDYGGSPQQQLAQCQRYYFTGNAQVYSYAAAAGAVVSALASLPVQMRTSPTVTLGTPTANSNMSGPGANPVGSAAVVVFGTGTAVGTVNYVNGFFATADL